LARRLKSIPRQAPSQSQDQPKMHLILNLPTTKLLPRHKEQVQKMLKRKSKKIDSQKKYFVLKK